jgi:hypothetical protein
MNKTRALALGLAAAGGVLALGALAAPASATESKLPKCHTCTTVVKTDASGILTTSNGEAQTANNPASTAVVTAGVGIGVEVTLPDASAKVGYTVPVDEPVLLAAVAKLQYSTWQLNPASVALPSLNLTLDFNGPAAGGFTTLVYEPYQDGQAIHPNQWQTWDALRSGDALWWSTRAIPGGASQATPMSWTSILAANPDAVMKAWGLNFGKGAPGAHARWGAVTVGTIDWCTTTIWTHPKPTPSASSASPTVSPTVVPTTPSSAPPTTTQATTPPPDEPSSEPAGGGQGGQGIGQGPGSLALTGASTPLLLRPAALVGMALTAIGLGLFLAVFIGKRRRSHA